MSLTKQNPFLNPIYKKRAKEIVSKMTLSEKVSLMGGKAARDKIHGALKGTLKEHYNEHPYEAGGNEKYGVPALSFCDGPRGVVCGRGVNTCFPSPVMRSASFNPELETEIGVAIGREALANGANFYGGICINVPYHPGWGRSQETYGEDTYLIASMGSAMIRGVQSQGVIACIKHFAFNSMENLRFEVDVDCDLRTEREIFLRQFELCVKEAHAGAVMTAYNKFRGVLCGHNQYLLKKVLRDEWNFDGIVMSDFTWGIRDTVEAANAGECVEMADTRFFGPRLEAAVRAGLVTEQTVDDATERIIATLFYFQDFRSKIKSSWKEHQSLALKSAEEGIVLLKNDYGILPLNHKKLRKIAVFGRLAEGENTGDRGSARVYPPYTVSPLQGMINYVGTDTEIIYYRGKNIHHARRMAEECDAVIMIAGYDYRDEGEAISKDENSTKTGTIAGGDRTGSLRLHEEEERFLEAVSGLNPRTVVILMGGSTIIPGSWHEKVPAMIFCCYAGMEGGNALAEILFGLKDPGGRLPFVIPFTEDDLPRLDFSAPEVTYGYWHGYRKLLHDKKQALFPFGFGLSYFKFSVSQLNVELEDRDLVVSAFVRNCQREKTINRTQDRVNRPSCGTRKALDRLPAVGSTVIQVYIQSPEEDSVRVLRGFQKVHLQRGESEQVTIRIPFEHLKIFGEEGNFVLLHGCYNVYIGTSSREQDLQKLTIEL
jgi:beta-glucosidase